MVFELNIYSHHEVTKIHDKKSLGINMGIQNGWCDHPGRDRRDGSVVNGG
jgi:hypothetical protein